MMQQRSLTFNTKTYTATVVQPTDVASHFQSELTPHEASLRSNHLRHLNLALSEQTLNRQRIDNPFSGRLFAEERLVGFSMNAFYPAANSSALESFDYRVPSYGIRQGEASPFPTTASGIGLMNAHISDPNCLWILRQQGLQESSRLALLVNAIELSGRQSLNHAHVAPGSTRPLPNSTSTVSPVRSLPFCLSDSTDTANLTPFQTFLRQHMEVFAATSDDIGGHRRGRTQKIREGQVGLRCRHCAHVPAARRAKGSVYFPASILGLYQAAQNASATHLQCGLCPEMPVYIKSTFADLLATKTARSHSVGGRSYWGKSAQELGDLVDTDQGIFARRSLPAGVRVLTTGEQSLYRTKNIASAHSQEGRMTKGTK